MKLSDVLDKLQKSESVFHLLTYSERLKWTGNNP